MHGGGKIQIVELLNEVLSLNAQELSMKASPSPDGRPQ